MACDIALVRSTVGALVAEDCEYMNGISLDTASKTEFAATLEAYTGANKVWLSALMSYDHKYALVQSHHLEAVVGPGPTYYGLFLLDSFSAISRIAVYSGFLNTSSITLTQSQLSFFCPGVWPDCTRFFTTWTNCKEMC